MPRTHIHNNTRISVLSQGPYTLNQKLGRTVCENRTVPMGRQDCDLNSEHAGLVENPPKCHIS